MSKVTYKFVKDFPCQPGLVVFQFGGKRWSWQPVCAMAVIEEHWAAGEDEPAVVNTCIVPLVPNLHVTSGFGTVDMVAPFGHEMESDNLRDYTVLHWGEIRAFICEQQVENGAFLEEYIDTFYGAQATAKALNKVADALQMLGFGNTSHPGALEGHTMKMMEKYDELSFALSGGLEAIAESLAGNG